MLYNTLFALPHTCPPSSEEGRRGGARPMCGDALGVGHVERIKAIVR